MASYATITVKGGALEGLQRALRAMGLPGELEAEGLCLGRASPPLERFYQQQEEFSAIAASLSKGLEIPLLAAMNLEDELLLLWAFDRGQPVFAYDSNPMVLACRVCSYSSESVPAELGPVEQLAERFGVPERARALKSWLGRRRGLGFLSERERHRRILQLLGLFPAGAS
ncbi:MAG: hypothetical protein K6T57_14855 [Thermaceae bacterium]|nr:hypothetical protein [Thermaceae bacterium]